MLTIQEKLERNRAFWHGDPLDRPLLSFHVGDHFFSRSFKANIPLLAKGTVVTPDMIDVDSYIEDYLRMAEESEQVDQDAVYTAEPCTGFPWIEAIFGAKVIGTEFSFVSEAVIDDVEDLNELTFSTDNAWYKKYLEFTEKLVVASDGRFPIGQPILRGVTDTVGSIMGQEDFACAVLTDPDIIRNAFAVVTEAQIQLIRDQRRLIPEFHGGYSMGFYNLWAPGSAVWYQEDLAALLSPKHHKEFLRECAEKIIGGYDYSMVHLHPASFSQLDSILEIQGLTAVQINKDVGGPSVRDMIPQCRKVLESGKRVVIGMAFFDHDDIDAIYELLPNHSTAIVALAHDLNEAAALAKYINKRKYV